MIGVQCSGSMQAALKSPDRGVADPESASGAYLTRDPDLDMGFGISFFLISDPGTIFWVKNN